MESARQNVRAPKISWKDSTAFIFDFVCIIFWENLFLCIRAPARALLTRKLKSAIYLDAFCTLNRQITSKIYENRSNSFSTKNPISSKFLKKIMNFVQVLRLGWIHSILKLWLHVTVVKASKLMLLFKAFIVARVRCARLHFARFSYM